MQFIKANGITYRKTNRLQVERTLEKGGSVRGFTVGNKVRPFHWFSGWCLAHTFELSSKEEFIKAWNAKLFYLDPEMGKGLAVWIEIAAES